MHLPLFRVFMSRFGRDLNPITMRLLVWRLMTVKFRLTFLILLTINFPPTATRRETRVYTSWWKATSALVIYTLCNM